MTTARRRSQPARGWEALADFVPREELDVLHLWHPNMLIAVPASLAEPAIDALQAAFRGPIVSWEGGTLPLAVPGIPGTVVLKNVDALSSTDQQRFLAWLQQHYESVQVVATTSRPILPLVQSGSFSDALYYALNVIHIDLAASAAAA